MTFKFRVWDEYFKKFRDEFLVKSNGNLFVETGFSNEVMYQAKDSYTIQQFTGLSDKNGREIYEGDIIQEKENNFEESPAVLYVVRYDESRALFYFDLVSDKRLGFNGCHYEEYKSEVIGNIFENPELLNKAE